MGFIYRMSTKEDQAELMRLWSDHSGWGPVDAATWEQLFLHYPEGNVPFVVAENAKTGEIVGQLAFLPRTVRVGGRTVKALKIGALIVSPELRVSILGILGNPFSHPGAAMYFYGIEALKPQGFELAYIMPGKMVASLFRIYRPMQCGTFPLWSLKLPLDRPFPEIDGYTAGPLRKWDDRVDRLDAEAMRLHGCSGLRDSRMLPWILTRPDRDYHTLALERDGELVGLVVSQHKKKQGQWLICDLLVRDADDSLRALLRACCNMAHSKSLAATVESPIREVSILVTPVLRPALTEMEFLRDDFEFVLAVHSLNSSLSAEVAPAHWYIAANE